MQSTFRDRARSGRFGPARPRPGELSPRDFGAQVLTAARRKLPEVWSEARSRQRYRLVQLHFGDPAIHYEVWVHARTERIEIGLHFEAERERNARWLQTLDERLIEIKADLGIEWELEPWDRGWVRLYRTLPPQLLTPELADTAGAYLAALVGVLQPILDEGAPA